MTTHNTPTAALSDRRLKARFEKLSYPMKMYFNERTLIEAWDARIDAIESYNRSRRWWQRKLRVPPRYHLARMPQLFPIPPFFDPQFEDAQKLIDEYMVGVQREIDEEFM